MSKVIEKYNELKRIDKNILYAFKIGAFFVFLNEDAKFVSEKLNLKITPFGNNAVKCGIPINSKESKLNILESQNIKYNIIEIEHEDKNRKVKNVKKQHNIVNDIIDEILSIDLLRISEREAFIKLCDFQIKLKNK